MHRRQAPYQVLYLSSGELTGEYSPLNTTKQILTVPKVRARGLGPVRYLLQRPPRPVSDLITFLFWMFTRLYRRRIMTDYGFEGHPLRKDFPLTVRRVVYIVPRMHMT